ncbi:hypothetical protein STEG23_029028, partial [Scotinomys teguina]
PGVGVGATSRLVVSPKSTCLKLAPSKLQIDQELTLLSFFWKMRTCGLLPGWYGLTSQDLLTALQMFQNPDQLQDNWLKDEASQTAPVKIGPSS